MADRDVSSASGTGVPWSSMGELHASAYEPRRFEGDVAGETRVLTDERLDARRARREAAAEGVWAVSSGSIEDPYAPAVVESPQHFGREYQRRSGRRLVIWGLLCSLLFAPFVAVVGVIVTADLLGLASRLQPVAVGDSVDVDSSGGFLLIEAGGGSLSACSLKDGAGVDHALEIMPSAQPAFWVANLTPGAYVLDCEGSGDSTLMGASGIDPNRVISRANYCLLVSSIVGFAGVAMTIVGARRIAASRR